MSPSSFFSLNVLIRIDKNLFFGEVNIQKREFCVKGVSAQALYHLNVMMRGARFVETFDPEALYAVL
jgi:hypothetical protein